MARGEPKKQPKFNGEPYRLARLAGGYDLTTAAYWAQTPGLTRMGIHQIECGDTEPSDAQRAVLATIYGVSEAFLTTGHIECRADLLAKYHETPAHFRDMQLRLWEAKDGAK
jgi:transcriptional regulator with XRE-family HTH domain